MDERMVVQGKQRELVVESWLAIVLPSRRLHAGGGIWYVVQYYLHLTYHHDVKED